MSQRHPSEPTDPAPELPPSVQLRWRRGQALLVAREGSQLLYICGLIAVTVIGKQTLLPAVDAVRDATVALRDSATTLRAVADDAQMARLGVERLGRTTADMTDRLGRIEGDVAALRADVRANCRGMR